MGRRKSVSVPEALWVIVRGYFATKSVLPTNRPLLLYEVLDSQVQSLPCKLSSPHDQYEVFTRLDSQRGI
jgi:hypothetical protein